MLRRLKPALARLKERATRAVAYALPSSIAYWATIRVGAHATTGACSSQNVPELLFMDALKRWATK